jgi:hypothetical protein
LFSVDKGIRDIAVLIEFLKVMTSKYIVTPTAPSSSLLSSKSLSSNVGFSSSSGYLKSNQVKSLGTAPNVIPTSSIPYISPSQTFVTPVQPKSTHVYGVEANLPLIGTVDTGYKSSTHTIEYGRPDNIQECGLTAVGTEITLGMGSFAFGVMVGVIIISVILLIMYLFRVLFFSDVPTDYPTCNPSDYYLNPGEALANTGLHASDMLFVSDGKLFYKRVPQSRTCTPGQDQIVEVPFPQYCLFARDPALTDQQRQEFLSGDITIDDIRQELGVGRTNGVSAHNTEAAYQVEIWREEVDAAANCQPVFGAALGRPLAKWDPSIK